MNRFLKKSMRYMFLFFVSIRICISAYSQLIPNFEMTFKVVNPLGEDSVIIGLSTEAGNGYDENFDIIDTTELQLPVDLRVYDAAASEQLGNNCKHFSRSYQSLPTYTPEIASFERAFIFALRVDLDQIDAYSEGSNCSDPSVTDQGTYLRLDMNSMYNYQFINNAGYYFDLIDISHSNGWLVGIDGYNWQSLITPEEHCLTIIANNSQSNPDCNIDIYFRVKLLISNKLYLDTEGASTVPKIITTNDRILIENLHSFETIFLYDLHGKLLQKRHSNNNSIIFDVSSYAKQMYLLHLSNHKNSHYLIHKILNL